MIIILPDISGKLVGLFSVKKSSYLIGMIFIGIARQLSRKGRNSCKFIDTIEI